jgi:Undecaprenyl-phosphate glucose phosphotransferase
MRPRRLPDIMALSPWLLPLSDMLAVALSAILPAVLLSYYRDVPSIWPLKDWYQVAITFAMVLTPLVFFRLKLYRSHRGESLAIELVQVLGAWFTVLVMLGFIAIATKTSAAFSRVWMVSWALTGMSMLWVIRIILRKTLAGLRARGWDTRNIVLIGAGPEAARVLRHLARLQGAGYRVTGYFGDPGLRSPLFERIPYLGGYQELAAALTQLDKTPDQVWIALPADKGGLLKEIVQQLGRTTLDFRLVPDTVAYNILNHAVSQIGGLPIIELSSSPMTGLNRVVKALEDRLLASIILFVASPLMLLIAFAIKVDSPGPVIFRQKRHGWNGEEITVFKFRTMVVHGEGPGHVTQARRHDPRLTRLGRLLRRTSLDEMPQFFNVLMGTMSVVGPRPHAIEHNLYYQELVGGYILRHKVKPGITGWAQVSGFRGETETLEMMRQRVEYDLYYIEHWSIWFDLVIVLLTLVRGFLSQRAY